MSPPFDMCEGSKSRLRLQQSLKTGKRGLEGLANLLLKQAWI